MDAIGIIKNQIVRLNSMEAQSVEEACKIAELVVKLTERMATVPDEPPVKQTSTDTMSFTETCKYLGMGAATLKREMERDPYFPVYQPYGKGGRLYFSKARLDEWKGEQMKRVRASRNNRVAD